MKNFEEENWKRTLQAIDQRRSFDAQAFAERVISERSRRKKRRVRAGCLLVSLAVLGLAYDYFPTTVGRVTVSERSSYGSRQENTGSTGAKSGPASDPEYLAIRRIQEIDSKLAHLDDQGRRWRRLAGRRQHTRAELAAAKNEQQTQRLAMLRAEQSRRIEIPDLTVFHVGRSENMSE